MLCTTREPNDLVREVLFRGHIFLLSCGIIAVLCFALLGKLLPKSTALKFLRRYSQIPGII